MKNSKSIKILISILIILLGIFISTNVNAADGYRVFYNDIKVQIVGGRLRPYERGSFLMACIAPHEKYSATLTLEEYQLYHDAYGGYDTAAKDKGHDHNSKAVAPWTGKKYTMYYTQGAQINEIEHQDTAYILNVAKERGQLTMIDTAHSIWASSVILNPGNGRIETPPNELAAEGEKYKQFYDQIHPNGVDEFANMIKDQTFYNETDPKRPEVYVNQDTGKYTVGAFNVYYPDGASTIQYNNTNANNGGEGQDEVLYKLVEYCHEKVTEKLTGLLEFSEDFNTFLAGRECSIYKEEGQYKLKVLVDEETYKGYRTYNIYGEGGELTKINADGKEIRLYIAGEGYYEYINQDAYINYDTAMKEAREILGQSASSFTSVELMEARNKLARKYYILTNDSNVYNIISNTVNTTIQRETESKDVRFAWISKVELVGCDADGNAIDGQVLTIDKDKHEFDIINANGALLHDTGAYSLDGYTINYIENMNIPKNEEDFYVQFQHGNNFNENVKRIKVKMYFVYLESCYAEMYEYNGIMEEWYWSAKTTSSNVCHTSTNTPTYTCAQMGHSNKRCPNKTPDNHKGTTVTTYNHYFYYTLKRNTPYPTQKLMATALNLHKNYKNAEITLGGNTGIDITMELGGYVFLDKDEGKVNEGDSKLDQDMKEAIPGAEVWLYDTQGNLVDIKDTNEHGQYVFTQLNAQKKYYVRFVYNGMLYTNVAYNIGNPAYNTEAWKVTSKATENNAERIEFNNRFAEIGSYPTNYKITNKIFGNDLGDYNKTYLQETIVDLFKEVTNEIVTQRGNEAQAYQNLANKYNSDPEIKNKLQFIADCRISAYTNGDGTTYKQFPIYQQFTIDTVGGIIGGVEYKPIYDGQYWINLGIKGRPTFDLYLGKDVYKATVSINGKTETYKYNYILHRAGYYDNGFPIGIAEDAYLEIMRSKYTMVDNTRTIFSEKAKTEEGYGGDALQNYINQSTSGYKENRTYDLEMRPEEIAEGVESTYYTQNNIVSSNEGTFAASNTKEQLDVKITYKITVTNESSVLGAPTEIVDYYDKNYTLVDAYIGNDKGEKVEGRQITIAQQSKYANAMYKNDSRYNTVYLQPNEKALADNETLYVYVVLQLNNASQTLINNGLLESGKLESINVAEINGYKTYNTNNSWGLIDKDSIPGNLDIRNVEFNKASVDSVGLEDDSKRAPAFVYKKRQSKTIEGIVFEDATDADLKTSEDRKGNGTYENTADIGIAGVIVELVEYNNDGTEKGVVARTTTNEKGWYGFVGFVAGNYKVRYTYGSNDDTALRTDSKAGKGLNAESYNGQDFQSTTYNLANYTDQYWYDKDAIRDTRYSDAQDTVESVGKVISYSKEKDGVEIVNHKAEVFNSYQNKDYYTNYYPEMSDNTLKSLKDELEKETYRIAETAMIYIEVEKAKTDVDGNKGTDYYTHQISNIDFGVAERPRSELVIDQDVKHIKVTATDGTVLFDTETGVNNLQWIKGSNNNTANMIYGKKIEDYDKGELINIIMDDELLSGSTLEITYNITVTNNGENDNGATTRAKNIINYVANNLNFEVNDNKNANGKALWEVVKLSDIQKDGNSTWINSRGTNKVKYIDLSTQTTTLKATNDNPLTKALAPGKSATAELKLKKVLSAESSSDDLQYTNMTEIVEIDNTVGRYDHGAIPGNQDLEKNPTEHDTSGASSVAAIGDTTDNPQDGTVIVTPPTGSKMIYYAIGITATVILAVGIYLIKKFVIDRNK